LGVEEPQRLTNLLESATGKPHLNFSMAHFSPYQAYLVYRELASKFAHDAVLLGIFPFNDFIDLDYHKSAHAPGYEYRYRPYLVGNSPDYLHVHYRESDWQRFLRRRSYAYSAIEILLSRLRGHDLHGYQWAKRADERGLQPSYYYDYTQPQLDLLKHCIQLIREQAGERPVAVVLFPAPLDLLRYRKSGPSPLADELRRSAEASPFQIVDLLPKFYRSGRDAEKYYLSLEHGDFHLSPRGNQVAAEFLHQELADFYRP